MPDRDRRVRIVCEDRLTERFLSKVCQRQKLGVLHVEVAPSGKGAASTWVRRRYPEFVKLHRSKNYQGNLCLLVAIDGDNKGVSVRKLKLAQELITAEIAARKPNELIAVFVPTWSIETWLASLVDGSVRDERVPLKEDNESAARMIPVAANNWRAAPPLLPSLEDAYVEGQRIGI